MAWFEKEKLPAANGAFAVGRENLEARYRAEELIDVPAAQLLALGERELAANEAAFVAAAARVDPKRPALDVWADVLKNHPARGALVSRGAEGRRRTAGLRRCEEPGHAALRPSG